MICAVANTSVSLSTLVALNLGLLSVGLVVGWLVSGAADAHMVVNAAADERGALLDDVQIILAGNLHLVGMLLIGACTLGLFTVMNLIWNGYFLGFGLSALSRTSPEAIPLLMQYVPLEFLAFTLVAASAQKLAFSVLCSLAAGGRIEVRRPMLVVAVAVAMLVVAAFVEANVKSTMDGSFAAAGIQR